MSPRSPQRTHAWRQTANWLPAVLVVLLLAVLWQLGVMIFDVQSWLLPSPIDILKSLVESWDVLSPHIWQTFLETLLGFSAALMLGLGLGFLIDLSPTARKALYPLLVTSQTIPTVAIAPILAIWFGYGILPKVIVVALVCFFPIVISTADGLRASDRELVNLLRTMGASQKQLLFKVRIPGALPIIFSGIRIGITYSVVGAILGEWVGASKGLGIFMLRATNSFRTDWVFASILVTSIISIALFALVSIIERLTIPWFFESSKQEVWEEIGDK